MTRQRIVGALNVLGFILFTSWALFQYNDPDALLWIVLYGLAAVCIVLFHLRRISSRLLWTYSIAALIVGLYMAVVFLQQPAYIMEEMAMLVEEGREMVGAWVVSAWMAFLAMQRSRVEIEG